MNTDQIDIKKSKNLKTMLVILIYTTISLLLALFALFWQDSFTLMAFCNAFYFSGFILFFIGWMILMANLNILSPLIYGLKTFFLMFAGKKPANDYYTYSEDIKNNPIKKIYYFMFFLFSIPNFIVAVILHILLP